MSELVEPSRLHYLVLHGPIEEAMAEMKENVSSLCIPPGLLQAACHRESTELAEWLLKHTASANEEYDGINPMRVACETKNTNMIELLILHGGLVKVEHLEYVIQSGSVDLLKYFHELGADLKCRNHQLLRSAASAGRHEIVKMLIEYGLDINQSDEHGITPLIYASAKGHSTIVKILIDEGADVNLLDNEKKTALEHAVIRNNLHTSQVLMPHVELTTLHTCCQLTQNKLLLNELNDAFRNKRFEELENRVTDLEHKFE